jgi:hypothetical protein
VPKMSSERLRVSHHYSRPYVWGLFGLQLFLGDQVKQILTDPRFFNFLIMSLYALSAARWAYEKRWADMCYWLSALAITLTVTFGYKH